MDTILELTRTLGVENMTDSLRSRIATLERFEIKTSNLEQTYSTASDEDKAECEEELNEAKRYLSNLHTDVKERLEDEISSVKAKEQAEAKEKEQAEIKAKAETENQKPKEEKSSGVGGLIVGGLILLATLGAVNILKNKK